jgi:hypothetical protein
MMNTATREPTWHEGFDHGLLLGRQYDRAGKEQLELEQLSTSIVGKKTNREQKSGNVDENSYG